MWTPDLPSDAFLEHVDVDHGTGTSGTFVTGYTFFWTNAADLRGGDRIIIGVDNVTTQKCTHYKTLNCTYYCDQWQTVYHQHMNYMYRLWREPTGGAIGPGGMRPYSTVQAGAPLVSSSAAFSTSMSQAISKGLTIQGTFVGYTWSYWTPPFWSTDNTAYPAYNFYLSSGVVVTADAGTGLFREFSQ